MRDRNQNFDQFHIQLNKQISLFLQQNEKEKNSLLRMPVFGAPTLDTLLPEFRVKYPRDFRLLRVLSIIHWKLPENLFFKIHLDLEEMKFSWLNSKQKIEIQIYLSSEINSEKYLFLTQRYSGGEIFGNILGNDLKELFKILKISKKFSPKPRRKVYRRGPKDKGTKRTDSSISILVEEIRKDKFIQEEYEKEQNKEKLIHKVITQILINLENY